MDPIEYFIRMGKNFSTWRSDERKAHSTEVSTVLTVFKLYGIREGITPEEHMAEVRAKHYAEFQRELTEKHRG